MMRLWNNAWKRCRPSARSGSWPACSSCSRKRLRQRPAPRGELRLRPRKQFRQTISLRSQLLSSAFRFRKAVSDRLLRLLKLLAGLTQFLDEPGIIEAEQELEAARSKLEAQETALQEKEKELEAQKLQAEEKLAAAERELAGTEQELRRAAHSYRIPRAPPARAPPAHCIFPMPPPAPCAPR